MKKRDLIPMKGYVTKNARHHSVKLYAVTGTKHGSLVYAKTEGDARKIVRCRGCLEQSHIFSNLNKIRYEYGNFKN
jgi:hypothetical protein